MSLFDPNLQPSGVQPKNPCDACDKREREAARVDAFLNHATKASRGIGIGALADSMGVAQMARAPGKMFSRSDILAILRSQRAVAGSVADAEYERLLTVFSNIE